MSIEENNKTRESYSKLMETLSKNDIRFEDIANRVRGHENLDLYGAVRDEFYTNREQSDGQKIARQFAQFLSSKLINGDDANLDATFTSAFGLYKQLHNDRDKVLAFDELHKLVEKAGGKFDLEAHKIPFMKNFDQTRFDIDHSLDVSCLMSKMYQWEHRYAVDDENNQLNARLGKTFNGIADDLKAFISHNQGKIDYAAPVVKNDDKTIQAIKDAKEYPLTEAHQKLFGKIMHTDLDFPMLAKQTDIILLDKNLTDTQKANKIADAVTSAYYVNPMKTEGQIKAKQAADTLTASLKSGNDKEYAIKSFIDVYKNLDVLRDRNLAINQVTDNLKSTNDMGSLKSEDRQKLVDALNDINGDKRGLDYVLGGYKAAIKNHFSGVAMENMVELKKVDGLAKMNEAAKQNEVLSSVINPTQQDGKITFTLDAGMLDKMKRDGKSQIVIQLNDDNTLGNVGNV